MADDAFVFSRGISPLGGAVGSQALAPKDQWRTSVLSSTLRAPGPEAATSAAAVGSSAAAGVSDATASIAAVLALGLVGRRAANWRLRRRRRQSAAVALCAAPSMSEPMPSFLDLTPELLTRQPPQVAGYVIREPGGRTKAAQVLHHRITNESQYQAVLSLVETYLHKFDLINMIGALHMCAATARDHQLLLRQIQTDPNFVKLFHAAKAEILKDVSALEPRSCSSVLWSCARLNIFDSDLFTAIIASSTTRMETFSPQGISMLVFALGFTGQRPRASFMQALVRETKARLDTEFDPVVVTSIVYGLMRLGIKDDRLMKLIRNYIVRQGFDDFGNLSIACFSYSLSKLEYFDEQTFALLGSKTLDNIDDFEPIQICMVALAFAQATGTLNETSYYMEKLENRVLNRLDEFDNRSLSTLCFSLGKYRALLEESLNPFGVNGKRQKPARVRVANPTVAAFVLQVIKRGMDTFSMAELNLINYGIMRIGDRDEDFLKELAQQFAENAPEMGPVEISNTLYAFARQDFLHIQCVDAMLGELKRRKMLSVENMTPEGIATIAYSLATLRVKDEEVFEIMSTHMCERVREFSVTSISMFLWSMAVLNIRTNAEPLVSVCLEHVSELVESGAVAANSANVVLWAATVMVGSNCAIWGLRLLFNRRFWENQREENYSMAWIFFASLSAELGVDTSTLYNGNLCKEKYSENNAMLSRQNERLSDRLRIQLIPHAVNSLPIALEGSTEAGIRVDIAIEKLRLVIEVEGPQRMNIPLDKLIEKHAVDGGADPKDFYGRPEEVLMSCRELIECGLSGPAAFKRRVLRRCGWRVVTVSFDENEEYIADALEKMIAKAKTTTDVDDDGEDDENFLPPMKEQDGTKRKEMDASFEGPDEINVNVASSMMNVVRPGISFDGDDLTGDKVPDLATMEIKFTPEEKKLRAAHTKAIKELRRVLMQERGDAAGGKQYKSHLDFRRWQVGVEKKIIADMMASLS